MTADIGLGLVWFTGPMPNAYVLDAKHPQGRFTEDLSGLLSDHRYLTNLDYNTFQEALETYPQLLRQNLPDNGLIVSIRTIASELGMVAKDGSMDEGERLAILRTVYRCFVSACQRLGIDPIKGIPRQQKVRETIFRKTTVGVQRTSPLSGVPDEDLSAGPHRWVKVPSPKLENVYWRTITLDRYTLYSRLLSMPTPVGDWFLGDPSEPTAVVLGAIGDRHDVLARVRISGGEMGFFPTSDVTQEQRRYYTGRELLALNERGANFEVLEWWQGETKPSRRLPEKNPLSLADGVIMEMIHRSWRENQATGFWLSVGERMALHHLAKSLHDAAIPVAGYGSGKITVITPKDPEAKAEQDERLLSFSGYGIQLPLAEIATHPKVRTLIPQMTALQALALSGVERLANIDDAISRGDGAAVEAQLKDADAALSRRFTSKAKEGEF